MIKTVIFDFDYTLGDSTEGIVLSANYALEQMGYPAAEVDSIRGTVGLSLKDTYAALTERNDAGEAERFTALFREKADDVMVDSAKLYDGVKDVLQKLRTLGLKIGIVTTKFRYRIDGILKKFDANALIDMIVGAEDVKVEKPNPEGLLFAISHLQTECSEVLYVGDSIVDAKTAKNAGVSFAGVLTGTTTREDFGQYSNVYIGEGIGEIYDFVVRVCNVE